VSLFRVMWQRQYADDAWCHWTHAKQFLKHGGTLGNQTILVVASTTMSACSTKSWFDSFSNTSDYCTDWLQCALRNHVIALNLIGVFNTVYYFWNKLSYFWNTLWVVLQFWWIFELTKFFPKFRLKFRQNFLAIFRLRPELFSCPPKTILVEKWHILCSPIFSFLSKFWNYNYCQIF